MPCRVILDKAVFAPSSNDVRYMQEWIRPWYDVNFSSVVDDWQK